MDLARDYFVALHTHNSLPPKQLQAIWRETAKAAVGKIIEHYGLPACCMAFETPTGMSIQGNYGITAKFVEHPVGGTSILFHGVDRNLPIIIYDALNDARYCNDPLVVGPPHVRFFIGVPIMLSRTMRIGTLCLMDTEPRTFYSLQECRFAMQATKEMAQILGEAVSQCLGEAGHASAHLAFTFDTLGTIPTFDNLPMMSCSTEDGSSASTSQVIPLSTQRA